MDFTQMDISTIMGGVTPDGARYLTLFLQEYTSVFSETVNPGCNKCLNQYLERYKKHFTMKNNNEKSGGFKLHEKYEGIPLEFGSQFFVTNANLTPEYAAILLSHDDGERYFSELGELEAGPAEKEKLQAAVDAARNKIENQNPNARQSTIDNNAKALKDAESALQEYLDANPDHEAAADIEVETDDEPETQD